MNVSSRTPEGQPHYCCVCGDLALTDPAEPRGDSTCPKCGSWLLTLRDALKANNLQLEDRLAKHYDSLDTVELVMELEEEFNLDIPEDELASIQTIADFIRLIRKYTDRDDEDDGP